MLARFPFLYSDKFLRASFVIDEYDSWFALNAIASFFETVNKNYSVLSKCLRDSDYGCLRINDNRTTEDLLNRRDINTLPTLSSWIIFFGFIP